MVAFQHSEADSLSADPSLLRGLNEEQQSRLTKLLDEYLVALENGESLDADEIVQQNPDLGSVFHAYLEKLRALYGVAAGMQATLDAPSVPLPTNKQLGDFLLHQEIGRGGMGVVYEASQQSLDRRVAIKLLPLASMLDSHQIARFKNEAHAAGLLQHPHIVPIHSVGSHQGVHYYAMQFIDGIALDAWVRERREEKMAEEIGNGSVASSGETRTESAEQKRDAWKQVIQWGIDIADALHVAHENGVVHRDVKPSNLMLDRSGKIWVTDFGLARCQTEMSLTRSGDVIGTMRYMSPEQARGQSALIDGRADEYSLAATLYECLTLRYAHEGDDAATILKRIDNEEVIPLHLLRPDLPRDLGTVIAKAMSKNREDRYETANEFADDMKRVLRGEPTIARPPSIADRLVRLASKHRRVALAAALIVTLGLVGSAIANAKLATAKQASDENALRATRGELLARGALDRMGTRIAELLVDIPAADSVRRLLLLEMLDYYERFAAEVKDDPTLREDFAMTLAKAGALQSELGDSEQAIKELKRSESIYAALAEDARLNDPVRLHWSTCQNNLAQALVRAGKLEDAARYFVRAMTTQQTLTDRGDSFPSQREAEVSLATTLNNMGLLLMRTDATSEAEKHFVRAIERLQPLLNESVSEAERLPGSKADPVPQKLAAVQSNLAGLLTESDPERAIQHAGQALDSQLKFLQSDPGDAKVAGQTIVTLNTLGAAQSATGRHTQAIKTFEQAIEIGSQVVVRWPNHPNYRRDLALSFNHLGLTQSKRGALQEARKAFEKALETGQSLAVQFPEDAETQSMLGGVWNNYGFLQQQLGETESAARAYSQAIKLQSVAVSVAPEVARYNDYLRKHQANHQKVMASNGNSRRQEEPQGLTHEAN
ncbi:protein kinase [Rhodopirellula islandica]|uniref:Protein kinase n=1 Tax=Rhodopirellula islandica TaxID=595434 RepID=A0A0J1BLW3_RHOIS|nr:serine/threonine-protein kinase [Rhodopirellula islandica]KLU07443.1 protein kinase [Rhodopirellula islandica]